MFAEEGQEIYDPTQLGSAVVGDLDPAVLVNNYFEVITDLLAAGRYTVTLTMNEETEVVAEAAEPGTLLLLGAGLLGLAVVSRRKRT